MLFNIVPQLFDVVAACIFISAELQVWIAIIVLITLGSYVPLTVILTELRVKYRRCDSHTETQCLRIGEACRQTLQLKKCCHLGTCLLASELASANMATLLHC